MLAQSPDTGMGMGSSTEAPAFSGPFGTRCKYNPLKHLAHRPAIGRRVLHTRLAWVVGDKFWYSCDQS